MLQFPGEVPVVASSWVAVVIEIMLDNLAQQNWPLFPMQLLAAPVPRTVDISLLSNKGMQFTAVWLLCMCVWWQARMKGCCKCCNAMYCVLM